MNKEFPKIYKAKLPPLNESDDLDGRSYKFQCNKTIDDENSFGIPYAQDLQNQNSKQKNENKSQGQNSKLTKSYPHSFLKNNTDEISIKGQQRDREPIFEKSQIVINGIGDSDSIIEADQSKNYLKQSNSNTMQYSQFHQKQENQINLRKAQHLDELGINENQNYTENKIDDNETIDIERINKMAETQQYIDNTFKNMIASQKQQIQQQQLQMQQLQFSQDNYEPPQCRICLEVYDEDDLMNNPYNTINQTLQNQQQSPGKGIKSQNGLLMSPCKCSGSSKYIHENCLKEWIKQTYEDYSLAQCEVCKQSYVQKLIYERKFKCNTQLLCTKPLSFLIYFIIWLLVTLLCVITTVIILLDIVSPDKYVPIFNKNVISNTAIYILFSIDILCDVFCFLVFFKYYFALFRIKILIDWQIMNFTKHPKEKHPKVIEKFQGTKEQNSATNRNVHLQLMMNNSIDNRNIQNNSLHNYQSAQGVGGLSQSQVSRQAKANSSQRYSQRLARNSSNIQTIHFFANMGVSENILNHFINQQQELNLDLPLQPTKSYSNIIMKKCDSEDGDNEEKSQQFKRKQSSNQIDQIGNFSAQSSIRQLPPSPILLQQTVSHITASEKITLRKASNNFLQIPNDERSPDKFNSQSTNFGRVEDNSQKQQWKKHVFFAKNQPYEIIVKPSDKQDDSVQEQNQSPKIGQSINQETVSQNLKCLQELKNSQKSLQKFFEEVSKGNQQLLKKERSNSTLKKVDSIIEVQEEELDKTQQNSENNQIFRACESFESNFNTSSLQQEEINQENVNEGNNDKRENPIPERTTLTPISQICVIKQKPYYNQKKQQSTSQRLQDILYQKIQQAHPEIQQKSYINQQNLNENTLNIDKVNENNGQLLSSINTQVNSQGLGDSQTQNTQINNKSFLSSNNYLSLMKNISSGVSSTYSKQDSREEDLKNARNLHKEQTSNEIKLQKDNQKIQDLLSQPQTILSLNEIIINKSQQNIQKLENSEHNHKLEASINNIEDMQVIDLESQ